MARVMRSDKAKETVVKAFSGLHTAITENDFPLPFGIKRKKGSMGSDRKSSLGRSDVASNGGLATKQLLGG